MSEQTIIQIETVTLADGTKADVIRDVAGVRLLLARNDELWSAETKMKLRVYDLERENARLLADKARLDWLQSQSYVKENEAGRPLRAFALRDFSGMWTLDVRYAIDSSRLPQSTPQPAG